MGVLWEQDFLATARFILELNLVFFFNISFSYLYADLEGNGCLVGGEEGVPV